MIIQLILMIIQISCLKKNHNTNSNSNSTVTLISPGSVRPRVLRSESPRSCSDASLTLRGLAARIPSSRELLMVLCVLYCSACYVLFIPGSREFGSPVSQE